MKEATDVLKIVGIILLALFVLAVGVPLVLAAEALLLTWSIYILGVRELPLFSQGYLLLAQVTWLFNVLSDTGSPPPWWATAGCRRPRGGHRAVARPRPCRPGGGTIFGPCPAS